MTETGTVVFHSYYLALKKKILILKNPLPWTNQKENNFPILNAPTSFDTVATCKVKAY